MGAYMNDIYQDDVFVEQSDIKKLFGVDSTEDQSEFLERLKSLPVVQINEKYRGSKLDTIYFSKILSAWPSIQDGVTGSVLRVEIKHFNSTYNFRVMKDPFGLKTLRKLGSSYKSKYNKKSLAI